MTIWNCSFLIIFASFLWISPLCDSSDWNQITIFSSQPPKYTTSSQVQQTNSQLKVCCDQESGSFYCWIFFHLGLPNEKSDIWKVPLNWWTSTSTEISSTQSLVCVHSGTWQCWYTFVVNIVGQCDWFQMASVADCEANTPAIVQWTMWYVVHVNTSVVDVREYVMNITMVDYVTYYMVYTTVWWTVWWISQCGGLCVWYHSVVECMVNITVVDYVFETTVWWTVWWITQCGGLCGE